MYSTDAEVKYLLVLVT